MLPELSVLGELDRCTVVLPRPGDGWYAPPQTGVSAGFPWGQLTSHGVQEMLRLGADGLGPDARPERFLLRAAGLDAAWQSAQALASGAARATGSSHVTEVFLMRCEELHPALCPGELDFPTVTPGAAADVVVAPVASDIEALRVDAINAVRTRFSGALDSGTWEDLCGVLASQVDPLPVGADVAKAVGNCAFSLWSAPFHADVNAASSVLGPLLSEMFRSLAEAADGAVVEEDMKIYVVPAQTLAVLAGTLGLAPELVEKGKDALLGPWPAHGACLEIELTADRAGEPCIRFAYNGGAMVSDLGSELLPWPSLQQRFSAYLE